MEFTNHMDYLRWWKKIYRSSQRSDFFQHTTKEAANLMKIVYRIPEICERLDDKTGKRG